jgi:hypothetical protein
MYIVKEKDHDYIGQTLTTTFHITYEWDGKETVIKTVEEENVSRAFFSMPRWEPTRRQTVKFWELVDRIQTALLQAKETGEEVDIGESGIPD